MLITLAEYSNPNASVRLPQEVVEFLKASIDNVLVKDSDQAVKFDNDLVRIKLPNGNYQWNISDSMEGAGGAGCAFVSKFKIIINNNQGYVVPTDDIIKVIALSEKEQDAQIKEIMNEIHMQYHNNIQLHGIERHEDVVYIVMENRGKSLDKLLPLDNDIDFYTRIALIVGICNELQQYERTKTIHRDLKPGNICVKKTGPGTFTVSGIDFGLAVSTFANQTTEPAGSYSYIAPEAVQADAAFTSATDRWALGPIIGQLFNDKNILKARREATAKYTRGELSCEQVALVPYSYKGLFDDIDIPNNIDNQLLMDIEYLLDKLQSIDPKERPSIDFITKFFTLIPQRAYLLANSNAMAKVKTHYETTAKMLNENLPAMNYVNPFPKWPTLNELAGKIEGHVQSLRIISHKNNSLKRKMTDEKFKQSNSTGIHQIRSILAAEEKTPLEKLAAIQAIGRKKSQSSLANIISRSSIFGKGRHENADKLYEKLAQLQTSKNLQDLCSKLDEVNRFIESNTFVH